MGLSIVVIENCLCHAKKPKLESHSLLTNIEIVGIQNINYVASLIVAYNYKKAYLNPAC